MWNINAHCILGYRRKMSEIIQLTRYENNERLGRDCLFDQNDHWNSSLSKNRPNCVFIGSFSINEVAVFGCVNDFINVSIGTQNIVIIFICISIFAKYGSLYSKYVHIMRRSTTDTSHSWAVCVCVCVCVCVGGGGGGGEREIQRYIRQPGYIAGLIYGHR